MARWPRVVVVDVAHHVTQRGNARQAILTEDADRVAYLELLRQYSAPTLTALSGRSVSAPQRQLVPNLLGQEVLVGLANRCHRSLYLGTSSRFVAPPSFSS